MASIIRVAGADFSANPIGFLAPVTDGLKAWHFLGGTAEKSARNLAPGGANALVLGAPTFSDYFASLSGAPKGGFDTGLADQQTLTYCAVARSSSGFATISQSAPLVGAYGLNGGVQTGSFLGLLGTGSPTSVLARAQATYNTSAGGTANVSSTETVSDPTRWAFYAGRVQTGVGLKFWDKTRNFSISTPRTEAIAPAAAGTIQIGQYPLGAYLGAADMAFASVAFAAWSDAQVDAVYQVVKSYLAKRSIAI